jgi:hypothetical protein
MELDQLKTRNRGGWSKASLAYLERVQLALDDLRDYWPLTLRQLYYRLVSDLVIENRQNEYRKLSRDLTKARLHGLIPWEAIHDRSRTFSAVTGWPDPQAFVTQTVRYLSYGYARDLLQTQPRQLELWIEKDALSKIFQGVADEYHVPVVVARGFSSISFVHECAERVRLGRPTTILYFGDLDPSGWEMLPAMMETLQLEMEIGHRVEAVRCALNPDQVEQYELPRSIDAVKAGDPRAGKYVEQFGDLAVELDALSPPLLEEIARREIEAHLDMDLLAEEQALERAEQERLGDIGPEIYGEILTRLKGTT